MSGPNDQQDLSIREDLSAAFDAAEAAAESAPPPEPTEAPEPPAEGSVEEAAQQMDAAGQARDEKGRFKPKEPVAPKPVDAPLDAPLADAEPPAEPQGNDPAQPGDAAQVAAEPEGGDKPPASWKPLAREAWKDVPKAARAEIQRREQEIAVALQRTAGERQVADAVRQVVAPYEAMIRSEGATPIQAIDNLFRFSYQLRTAPPAHKAKLVAGMIKQFLPTQADLEMLNEAIIAEHSAQPAAQGQTYDPRVDQILQKLQTAEERARQNVISRYQREIDKFAETHEFFPYVREDMGILMELADKRGIEMDFEEAYRRACMQHPEISEVLAQRDRAAKAKQSNASTLRARAAASTVRGTPAGVKPTPQSDDLRSEIERAVDEVSTRMR